MKQYEKSRTQSLKLGFEILKCFTPNKPTLRFIDIADEIGISKATVFHYLSTLTDIGYLKKDEKYKGYKQQIKTFRLKYVFLAAKIIKTARYVIMKLSENYPYKAVYEKGLS